MFLTNTSKFDIFSVLTKEVVSISVWGLLLNLFVALITGLFIYFIYKFTYSGVAFNRNFGVAIIVSCLVTAVIMIIISSNLALSLGMVGALSIIRFRNAIKDPRDIAFIFWAVASGLAAGVGIYSIAFLGSLFIGIVIIVFNLTGKTTSNFLLIIKSEDGFSENEFLEVMAAITSKYRLRMKNYSNGISESIYEVKPIRGKESVIVESVSKIDHIKAANLVSNNENN